MYNSKINLIIKALHCRDMNGSLDIANAITFLKLYFIDSELEMIIDVLQEIDYKLKDKK
jgi:hypothetical protein